MAGFFRALLKLLLLDSMIGSIRRADRDQAELAERLNREPNLIKDEGGRVSTAANLSADDLETIAKGDFSRFERITSVPGIVLKPGEEGIAFIRGYELMDQVRTPGRYRSIGVSTGGMSLRTGAVQLAGSGVQFRSLGKGDLLITNKRFIFMGQSTSFEVKLNRVLGALPYRSGFELSISGKPRTYTFYAPLDGRIPVAILRGAIKNFSIS